MKNRYVFIGPTSPMTYHMVSNLFKLEEVKLYREPLKIRIKKFDYIFVHSIYHLERFFHGIIATKMVYIFCRRKLLEIAAQNQESIFVYFYPWIGTVASAGIIDEIRRQYPDIRHIAIFYDIQVMKNHDLALIKSKYDLVSTYDKREADLAGVVYIPPVYSKEYSSSNSINEYYDVFFVGKAKDRLNVLIGVYDKLEADGFVCRFLIFGVAEKDQLSRSGITYIKKEISVEDAFQYTCKAKCLLEIVPYNTSALTGRYREAVIYNKKLLSNNKSVIYDKYYNPKMIQYFESVDQIDTSFLNSPLMDYNYQDDYEAVNLLKGIEENLKT